MKLPFEIELIVWEMVFESWWTEMKFAQANNAYIDLLETAMVYDDKKNWLLLNKYIEFFEH